MHLVSCYIITAYIYGRDISWSVFFSTREMNIALLDVDGFQTWFGSVQFSSFCFWEHRVTLYSLCFKGEFQRYFEGFYVCFTYLSRTKKYLCARSQLSTRNKTLQLIRFTRRTETTTDLKSALAKQPLRCEANYQRKIYYSIKLKEPQFTTAVTNKIKPIDATINPLKHSPPGIDSSNLQGNLLATILTCSFE